MVWEMSFQCWLLVSAGGVISENLPLPVRVMSALMDSAGVSSDLVSMLTPIWKEPTSPLKSAGGLGGRSRMFSWMVSDRGKISCASRNVPRLPVMGVWWTMRVLKGPRVAWPGLMPETVVWNLPTW